MFQEITLALEIEVEFSMAVCEALRHGREVHEQRSG